MDYSHPLSTVSYCLDVRRVDLVSPNSVSHLHTPLFFLLSELVTLINSLQSSLITQVSYYTTVTPFAEYVRSDPDYDGVILTGHSLGGGIAIISSAQSEIPAIAISGPNAMLSRGSFSPTLSKEAPNRHTFNVVPDRDMVPRYVADILELRLIC